MGIDISRARYQANRISNCANVLRDTRRSLESFRESLNPAWQAEEMIYVNRAIQSITNEMSSLASTLSSLESEIISIAYQIKSEEEAREAAARAAAEARVR